MIDITHHSSVHESLKDEEGEHLREKIQNTKKKRIAELKDMFSQFMKSREKSRSNHGEGSSGRRDYHGDPYS